MLDPYVVRAGHIPDTGFIYDRICIAFQRRQRNPVRKIQGGGINNDGILAVDAAKE